MIHIVSTHAPLRGATSFLLGLGNTADVSTHAPLRGATFWDHTRCRVTVVSTHAPLRGATEIPSIILENPIEFQPTHPCGVRLIRAGRDHIYIKVSTHAPLRGATGLKPDEVIEILVSTHAPLRGATLAEVVSLPSELVSTHAPLRGATPLLLPWRVFLSGFNPRTPAGCDFRLMPFWSS